MAENKVRFLRGTAAEYTSAVKDEDTFYYTTDDEKFYVGSKEITGGGITVDTALSDTSINPVQNKVIKAAIDNKANKTVATTTANGLMSAVDKTKLDGADDTYALKSKYGDTTINVGRKANSIVGEYSTAEGRSTTAKGESSHAEGSASYANGESSHAEGSASYANGESSHAEGFNTQAKGQGSHAEGGSTKASGESSHSEGGGSEANGYYSHAEGGFTAAIGHGSHAEGSNVQGVEANGSPIYIAARKVVIDDTTTITVNGSQAYGISSHAEGFQTLAYGINSHVEGRRTTAIGNSSHAEGYISYATGDYSHAEGDHTITTNQAEHASGKFNQSNVDTLFSVGDGTGENTRHNAFEITTTGGKLHDEEIMTQNNISNPNLLINPDFKINQRTVSGEFSEAGKYFVDRWKLDSGTVTINSDATLTLNGTISQILENASGTNVTASVSAGTASYDDSTKTFTITGNGVTISWAKLETGSTPTPFSPPDPATELMKCKRYYQRISSAYRQIANGFIQSTNVATSITPLPQELRIMSPTINFVGKIYLWYKGHIGSGGATSTQTASPPNVSQITLSMSFKLDTDVDASYIGMPCLVQFRDATSYIEINAEL